MNSLPALPSFLRASAQDAGNMSMRKAGRTRWNDRDWNTAASTLERLVLAAYGREADHNEPRRCFVRFQIAEQMERAGQFRLNSNLKEIERTIDAAMTPATTHAKAA